VKVRKLRTPISSGKEVIVSLFVISSVE